MVTIDARDTHAYPVMILLAFVLGLAMQYCLTRSRGMRREIAALTALAAFLCSAGCGLLLTFLTSGGKQLSFSSLGGLAGMYLGSLLVAGIARRPYYITMAMQCCTLVLPLMYSVSKIGCLLAGCCRGMDWQGRWAVNYLTKEGECTALPVQGLESVSFLLLFILGMLWYRKRKPFAVHGIFLLSALTKFLLDFLRASHTGQILSVTQLLCHIR